MTRSRTDVAILGGGLAGLSLACHLLETGWRGRRLVVIEAREQYEHDRVWCSWASDDHPFRDCVAHSWNSWRVRAGDDERIQTSNRETYRCIHSGRLYDSAVARIREHPDAELLLGTRLASVRERGDGVQLAFENGGSLDADFVFDSRISETPKTDRGEVELAQDFVGWHVKTTAASFDPERVTLMDFVAASDGVRFVYVLPFSEREALVESTAFSPGRLPASEHDELLRGYLGSRCPEGDYTVVGRERGCIPMSTRPMPMRASPRIHRIGTAGGMVKPSTGYSFETVQRWSRTAARDLAAGRPPRARRPRSWRSLTMDRMFLAFMRRHPEHMPAAFLGLFERVPADVLVRFLSDRSSLADAAKVAAALPKLPMLKEAARSWRLWLRS